MEENKKPHMYLITQEFPYGHLEDSFVGPEYSYLCKQFHVSVVAAELASTEELRSEETVKEQGFEARIIPTEQNIAEKLFSLLCFLLKRDCYIELVSIVKGREKIFKNIYRALMYGAAAETFYRRLKQSLRLAKDTRALFYFYWWDYKCLGLTMHKKRYPHIKIIVRTHGFDLYNERELYGRQYFKPQMDRELERVIFVAQYGKQYYLDKYKKSDNRKYQVHCLGVSDPKIDTDLGKDKIFHLVSCSNTIPLKRIELIIEGLAQIRDIEIKWVHFGDGSEMDRLKKMAQEKLGDNVDYNFAGRIPHQDVIAYYKENNVNCFITTTSTEGNPVSVQEALSFGIPIIATAVSDIPRMVDSNGVLLSENPTGDEVAQAIRKIAAMDDAGYIDLRKNSYRVYCRDYNVDTNNRKLMEDLSQII